MDTEENLVGIFIHNFGQNVYFNAVGSHCYSFFSGDQFFTS